MAAEWLGDGSENVRRMGVRREVSGILNNNQRGRLVEHCPYKVTPCIRSGDDDTVTVLIKICRWKLLCLLWSNRKLRHPRQKHPPQRPFALHDSQITIARRARKRGWCTDLQLRFTGTKPPIFGEKGTIKPSGLLFDGSNDGLLTVQVQNPAAKQLSPHSVKTDLLPANIPSN